MPPVFEAGLEYLRFGNGSGGLAAARPLLSTVRCSVACCSASCASAARATAVRREMRRRIPRPPNPAGSGAERRRVMRRARTVASRGTGRSAAAPRVRVPEPEALCRAVVGRAARPATSAARSRSNRAASRRRARRHRAVCTRCARRLRTVRASPVSSSCPTVRSRAIAARACRAEARSAVRARASVIRAAAARAAGSSPPMIGAVSLQRGVERLDMNARILGVRAPDRFGEFLGCVGCDLDPRLAREHLDLADRALGDVAAPAD